jgi:hypothetical protein
MSVQRRASKYTSRTVVPLDLRLLVRRREIVRSLETSDPRAPTQPATHGRTQVGSQLTLTRMPAF